MLVPPFHLILRTQQADKRPDARRANAGLARANASERNNADGRLSACPKGAVQIRHCGVAVLGKGRAIAFGLRLALAYLGDSDFAK